MHKNFEDFYSDNSILMKSRAKKCWISCRNVAVELLKAEAKVATGRTKVTIKRCIKIINENL